MPDAQPASHLRFSRFLGRVIPVFLFALALFYLLLRPAAGDLTLMAIFMGATALASVLAAYVAYRLGWINRFPSIRSAMMGRLCILRLAHLPQRGGHRVVDVCQYSRPSAGNRPDRVRHRHRGVARLPALRSTDRTVGPGERCGRQDRTTQARHACAGDWAGRTRRPGTQFQPHGRRVEAAHQKQLELEALRRDLIAWISHDLRTPLTSIRAILEALADGVVDDTATQQRYLRTAQRDIRSLSHLIDDLFDVAQMDAGGLRLDRQPNCLTDLISDTIEMFHATADRQGVRLEGTLAPDVDPVNMDASRIGRVLANLVGNALRHTPAGGCVRISALRGTEGVQIEVADTGEGIRPDRPASRVRSFLPRREVAQSRYRRRRPRPGRGARLRRSPRRSDRRGQRTRARHTLPLHSS